MSVQDYEREYYDAEHTVQEELEVFNHVLERIIEINPEDETYPEEEMHKLDRHMQWAGQLLYLGDECPDLSEEATYAILCKDGQIWVNVQRDRYYIRTLYYYVEESFELPDIEE